MVKKVRKVNLFNNLGEAIDMNRTLSEMYTLMETNKEIAYSVVTEGVELENGHYQMYQPIMITTREEYEEMKKNGTIKVSYK